MRKLSKAVVALGALALLGMLLAGTAQAGTLNFQMKNGNAVLADTEVTLYLSYGKEVAVTDAAGKVTYSIGNAKGFWVEVGGRRLARYFRVDRVPSTIDVAQVGFVQWRGGK